MEFGKRLLELRKSNKYSQQYMAELLGVSKSTYIKYERGERKPKYETLLNVSYMFRVSIDYLLGKENIENKSSKIELNVSNLLNLISDDDFIQDIENKYPGFVKVLQQFFEIITQATDKNSYNIIDVIYLITTIGYNLTDMYIDYNYLLYNEEDDMQSKIIGILSTTGEAEAEIYSLLNSYICKLKDEEYYSNNIPYFKKNIKNIKSRTSFFD